MAQLHASENISTTSVRPTVNRKFKEILSCCSPGCCVIATADKETRKPQRCAEEQVPGWKALEDTEAIVKLSLATPPGEIIQEIVAYIDDPVKIVSIGYDFDEDIVRDT
jgi:hypothetical protein